jgi:hypothetical protein
LQLRSHDFAVRLVVGNVGLGEPAVESKTIKKDLVTSRHKKYIQSSN